MAKLDQIEINTSVHNELINEIKALKNLLKLANEFQIDERVKVVKRWQLDGSEKWAVMCVGAYVINKELELEYEPRPRNRTKKFINRTRFNSLDDAILIAHKFIKLNGK